MYAPITPVAGITPLNDIFTPDTTQRWPGGMTIDAVDPYFGYGKFMYLQAGAAYVPGTLVSIVDQTFLTVALPSTANMGRPFYVARQNFGAVNDWGWFQYAGVTPLLVTASVAAGVAIGIGTSAGNAGTNGAGKQLLGVEVLKASTFTITKLVQTQNGSTVLGTSNNDGLFIGLAASGTGIAASTIATMDPSNRFLTLSAAATATATVTATFTYTGFVLAIIQNPHTQGAIT